MDPQLIDTNPAPPKIPLAPIKRVQARFNPLADVMLYVVVFVGGTIGTALRYGLSLLMPTAAAQDGVFSAFHTATFTANMLACFIFAFLTAYWAQATWIRKRTRELANRGIGMGMCGGFSTLSALVIENIHALQAGEYVGFVVYTLASFLCGLIVAFAAVTLALKASSKRAAHVAMTTLSARHSQRPQAAEGVVVPPQQSAEKGWPAIDAASGDTEEKSPITDELSLVADPTTGEVR